MTEDIRNVNAVTQSAENKKVNTALTRVPYPAVTGMELKADISFNGLTLNTIDSNSVVWVCTDIKGWWGLPDPEMRDLPRGWGDGSYDVRGRWMPRQLTLTGSFLPPSATYAPAARSSLISAASLVYTGGWLVVNESPVKACYVRLSSTPDIQNVNARGRTDFSIGLRAADPIKYEWFGSDTAYDTSGQISANSGNFIITNKGNIRVPVRVTFSGNIDGTSTPIILKNNTRTVYRPTSQTTTAEQIKIVGKQANQSSGAVFTVDTYNREILESGLDTTNGNAPYVNGARAKMDVNSDWIYLDPGVNTFTFTAASSSSKCEINFRSGWIG